MITFFHNYGLLLILSSFVIGALVSLWPISESRKNAWSHIFAVCGSLFGIITSAAVLLQSYVFDWQYAFPSVPSFGLHVRIDSLAAFFLLIIFLIALAASIYGISYMKKFIGQYKLAAFGFFYNIFLASLVLVVTAYHGIHFFAAWELMSVTSFFLIIFEHRKVKNIAAGTFYFIMTHVGAVCIFLALLLLQAYSGSFDFDLIRQFSIVVPGAVRSLIIILILIGFGIKAGVVPFHSWLPQAHPAAPTHVSGLLSGVMIKTAIFMLIRFFFDIFPVSLGQTWGIVILVLGAVSALLGVLYALGQHDIKRLLAYHSVENIGIILLGLGAAIVFQAQGFHLLAVLALVASLYHTINHAVFKTLLFLAAGGVIFRVHSNDMEEYGGLIRKMPYTALAFLIGAVAISALPPFNGFVSEWLTFQSLFAGFQGMGLIVKLFFIAAVVALATSSGLAAACFVKAFGATFLARPRSSHAENVSEVSILMRVSFTVLAVLCVVLALTASATSFSLRTMVEKLPAFANAAATVVPVISSAPGIPFNLDVSTTVVSAQLNIPLLAGGLFVLFLLVFLLARFLSRGQKTRRSVTWDCGSPLNSRMEITSTGFARSLIVMFRTVLQPIKESEVEYYDEGGGHFVKSRTVSLRLNDIYNVYFYRPLRTMFTTLSLGLQRLQGGNVNAYLLYMIIILVALLFWALGF